MNLSAFYLSSPNKSLTVVSDSVGPHRPRQPTRLPRPWDSPGKNTGVGCHFLLQCMKVKSESEVAPSCPTFSMDCSLPGSSIHGIFQARVLEWGAIAFSICLLLHTLKHLRLHLEPLEGCPEGDTLTSDHYLLPHIIHFRTKLQNSTRNPRQGSTRPGESSWLPAKQAHSQLSL